MRRREFLASTAAAVATISTPGWVMALDKDNKYRNEIGIQLYTLRNEINKDVAGTLKAVADAGYKQVECYGFPDAEAMMKAAKDNGLAMKSSHFNWDSIFHPEQKGVPSFQKILDQAKDAGLTDLVIPYLHDKDRKTIDDYKRVVELSNKAAEQSKKVGIQLAYHNHAFEFQPMDGTTGYQVMIDGFSPDMHFEVDVFWIQVGGKNPVELIRQLKGRVSQLHLKDLSKDLKTPNYGGIPKEAFEEIGDGVIDMEPIIKVAAEAGVKHCHVEQDHSPHPIKSIQQSIKHLAGL